MVSRDVPEFLSLDYLEYMNPSLVYLAIALRSPLGRGKGGPAGSRQVCLREDGGRGVIVMSPLVYLGELAQKGVHPPQGWYAYDLQLLARCDELLGCCNCPVGRTARACWRK